MNFHSAIYSRLFRKLCILILLIVVIFGCCCIINQFPKSYPQFVQSRSSKTLEFTEEYFQEVLNEEPLFLAVNNESGSSEFLVPNIIHFIRIDQPYIQFVDLICLLAAYKNHKPDKLWIHCNNCQMKGPYWEKAKMLIPIIELKHFQPCTEVFGKKFNNVWHLGDVARIRVLQQYGGIFLDNDVYVIRSLDKFRKFEMTAGWDQDQFIGIQILIAHPRARYLRLWYETYNDYQGDKWYYNGGELPTKAILWKHPEVLHRIKKWFGVDTTLSFSLYNKQEMNWKEFYTFHLLLHHIDLPPNRKEFNEDNVKDYDTVFGRMARLIYYGSEQLINSQSTYTHEPNSNKLKRI